jgi:hypothetical protein
MAHIEADASSGLMDGSQDITRRSRTMSDWILRRSVSIEMIRRSRQSSEASRSTSSRSTEAKLSYFGNALTENRHGLVVGAEFGSPMGTSSRQAVLAGAHK